MVATVTAMTCFSYLPENFELEKKLGNVKHS